MHRNTVVLIVVTTMMENRDDARDDKEESNADTDAEANDGFVTEIGVRASCCAL
jgi:hypothetical protein